MELIEKMSGAGVNPLRHIFLPDMVIEESE